MTDQQPPTIPGQPQQPAAPYAGGPPPAAWPATAPQPPKSRLDWWTRGPGIMLIIVAVGLVFVGIIALTGGLEPGSGSGSSASDVKVSVTSCEFSDSGMATVGITATNNGDRTQSVRVGIEYRDSAGARIDTDSTWVRDIPPGDTVRTEEVTMLDASATSGKCAVTSVR